MENNYFLRGSIPPFFFLLSLFLFSACGVQHQKISKYYTSLLQENGTLYFISPKQEFSNKNNTLNYDLTHETSKDSVTFNFTLLDKNLLPLDSLVLKTDTKKIKSHLNKIFVDRQKSKFYTLRYSAQFLFSEMQDFFQSSKSPSIIVYSKGKPVSLTMKDKKWAKNQYVVSTILNVIAANKSK